MIKAAANHYIKNCEPPDNGRLIKSSGSEELDATYKSIYNIEEYILYRKREIQYIIKYIEFIRNKNIILHILSKKCKIYNSENSSELLDKYLLPYNEISTINSRKIIKLSLGVDDKMVKYNCNTSNYEIICLYLDIFRNNITYDCMTMEYTTHNILEDVEEDIYYLYRNNIINLSYLYYLVDL